MTRDDVVATLRGKQGALNARGVEHAAVFGSLARGDDGAQSDIDIMIDIAPGRRMGVYEFVDVTSYIGTLFPIRVDVVERKGLKRFVRPVAEKDAVYAF